MEVKKLYRYEDQDLACEGEDARIKIFLREFWVTKETPCGWWISNYPKRWVPKKSRKKYAAFTKEGAKESFIARKTRELLIHSYRVKRAKKALELATQDKYND